MLARTVKSAHGSLGASRDGETGPPRSLRAEHTAGQVSAGRLFDPMTRIKPESTHRRVSDADKMAARHGEPGGRTSRSATAEDVAHLADALRAAKHAHAVHLAELLQGDVEPAQDWATWYAEYLLGVR
jgi:hypothetical protein